MSIVNLESTYDGHCDRCFRFDNFCDPVGPSELGADRFHFGVGLQGLVAHLPAPARLLVATEGQGGVEDVVTVDPDGAGPDLLGQGVGLGDVLGPDAGPQTVGAVVGHPGDLVEALEGSGHHHGAEDLLPDDLHVGPGVGEDGGLDEVAPGAAAAAAGQGGGAV